MAVTTDILGLLNEHRMENAFLIHTLETCPDTETHVLGASAAVYEPRSKSWLFRLVKEGDFTELYSRLEAPLGTFYVSGKEFFGEISSVIPDARAQEYIQYVIEPDMFCPDPDAINPDIDVVPIDKSWTEFILSLYKSEEFGHKDYIDSCIDLYPGFGALLCGEKIGYVLIHLDGEIGSMTISEKARGHGVGQMLMQFITPRYAAMASTGVGFVLPGNQASQHMMVKACFEPFDRNIIWVYHS